MFDRLGALTVRYWPAFLIGWAVLVGALLSVADPFDAHATPGEFAFLPEDSPSLEAERLFGTGELIRIAVPALFFGRGRLRRRKGLELLYDAPREALVETA